RCRRRARVPRQALDLPGPGRRARRRAGAPGTEAGRGGRHDPPARPAGGRLERRRGAPRPLPQAPRLVPEGLPGRQHGARGGRPRRLGRGHRGAAGPARPRRRRPRGGGADRAQPLQRAAPGRAARRLAGRPRRGGRAAPRRRATGLRRMSGRPDRAPSLVLASAPPRRRELLGRSGLEPEVVPAEVDETPRREEPADGFALRVAGDKASAVAASRPGAVVLAADTAVVLDGVPLGKPADEDDALVMLTRLSGRVHEVLTAVV